MRTEKAVVEPAITIRQVRHADLEQLEALDLKVFGRLAYSPIVLRQLFDVFHDCWLVADEPAGLAGYSLGAPTPDHAVAWLLALAVTPDRRRQGLGELLTLESLSLLTAMGIPTVHLTVEPGNANAIALYSKVGFTTTDLRKDWFGPSEDRVVMTRVLSSPV